MIRLELQMVLNISHILDLIKKQNKTKQPQISKSGLQNAEMTIGNKVLLDI